ncbi:PLP-dependent aminotransferase family protein [Shewanella sp. AS16]|uniref:MocR-like pyridoxine biosynthesis transcription factor PdxR n=1 Tax=Shewanella sp. AS16 TaxID=2907625 RepID=UPI001F19ACC5|nr:PLP-dependent aminotransferase family protein [Shewanella sp. AS16]MCE9687641.1 PLP-dependent aminotransferase family protein [Shewanella sp. AS16]
MGYKDIYQRYTQSILSGSLKPGEKVPSIRVLAQDLGVAKKTVEAAYDILIGEGYLVSRGARGTLVNPDLKFRKTSPEAPQPLEDPQLQELLELRDNPGFLRLGIPALDAFPHKKWLLLSGKAIRAMRPEEMMNPPVMGYGPLREAIANYVNISRGLNCSAAQVFITSGYKHSLALILQAMTGARDKVLFEEPGYFFGQKLLKRLVQNLHYVPVDDQGLDVDFLLRHHADARLVITTPSHHSPLAVTLSLPRRNRLLQWAQSENAWILEDDYDGEFHYTRKVQPALKSLDTQERVIYVGTFSKTIMPSIRVSYLVLPKSLVGKFTETGEIVETGQPLLPQKILTAFLSDGHFFKHLKTMRSLYQARRMMLYHALQRVYPDLFEFEQTDGGMHIIAYLKQGTQDDRLANLWQAHRLMVFPLSAWYTGTSRRYGLIMGYTNVPSEQEAVRLVSLPYRETMALLATA